MYQITWFDTAKTSKIWRRIFYDIQASSKQPFDTSASCTLSCASWVAARNTAATLLATFGQCRMKFVSK